jgi:hypothetical protein
VVDEAGMSSTREPLVCIDPVLVEAVVLGCEEVNDTSERLDGPFELPILFAGLGQLLLGDLQLGAEFLLVSRNVALRRYAGVELVLEIRYAGERAGAVDVGLRWPEP